MVNGMIWYDGFEGNRFLGRTDSLGVWGVGGGEAKQSENENDFMR
jgi:hypothetical protein